MDAVDLRKLVLVTGASGFIGSRLCGKLQDEGWRVRAAVRSAGTTTVPVADEIVAVGDIGPQTDWKLAVADVDAVVHLAARVHVMSDKEANPLAAFRRVNVDGTLQLANAALAAGVRRFCFVSSIKVNGEQTDIHHPFTEADPPNPLDPYGQSKLEAEEQLRAGVGGKMEVVIIRPTVVYGAGVKGNLLRLMNAARAGRPLPLGRVQNRRSMVGLGNLCSLIAATLKNPLAAGELFLASDAEALSTAELYRRISAAMGRRARLLPVPVIMMQVLAALAGRSDVVRRLTGSLVVDASKAARLLGNPMKDSVDDGLREMVATFAPAHAGQTED